MRLRIKFKIEYKDAEIPYFLNKYSNYNNIIMPNDLKNKSDFYEEIKYESFSSIIKEIDSDSFKFDENIYNRFQKQLKSYDEKSKRILFPIDINKTIFIHQFKEILHDFINLNYYDLGFFTEILKDDKTNIIFDVQIMDLEIDNYKICEDFTLKDILKDNDDLE